MNRPRMFDLALIRKRLEVSFLIFRVWRPLLGSLFEAIEAGDPEEVRELAQRLTVQRAHPSAPTWMRDLMRRAEVEARTSLAALAREPDQLERAVAMGEAALAAPPTSWEAEALDRLSLAETLVGRFEQHAEPRDIDAAIAHFQAADALCERRESADRPRLPFREGLRRWQRQFPPRKLAHDTVQWPPMDEFMRAHLLIRLANAYHTRFHALWAVEDLQRAVNACERAEALSRTWLWAVAPNSSGYGRQRGVLLSQLAAALVSRYELLRDPADIVRADWCLKDADRLMPRRDAESAGLARNRVHALILQAEALSRLQDVDKAAAVLRRRQPRDPGWLPQVQIALVRSEISGSDEGLDAAVRLIEARLADAEPAATPELLRWLGTLLWQWAEVTESRPSRPDAAPDAAPEAGADRVAETTSASTSPSALALWRGSVDAWRRLAALESVPAWYRLHAASIWARLGWCSGAGPAERADAAALAVRLLPTAAWRGLGRFSQEMLLTVGGGGLATTAAAAQLELGRPEQALELLELGRGVLWSQKLDAGTDLRLLSEHSEELADRLTSTRLLLERTRPPAPRPVGAAGTRFRGARAAGPEDDESSGDDAW